jgi:hypothetical protein
LAKLDLGAGVLLEDLLSGSLTQEGGIHVEETAAEDLKRGIEGNQCEEGD